jgi:hypothetical protein
MVDVTEKRLQQLCFTWFHNTYPNLRGTMWMTHNQAKNATQGSILKAMGMVPGVSDLLWFYQGCLYCIELKTETGKQSAVQKKWESAVEKQGAIYYVIRDLDRFKLIINALL